jgi:hypothetical protein
MRDLEGIIPICCWQLQSLSKLKNNAELTEFNRNCVDKCNGYNSRCPTYYPKDSNHSGMRYFSQPR